jgi:hypothetical protein
MKTFVLAIGVCLSAWAGEGVVDPGGIQATCAASKPVKKARKRHSPIYYLRRVGQAEVGLAIRLSSWGIHDSETSLPACPVRAGKVEKSMKTGWEAESPSSPKTPLPLVAAR